MSIEYRGILPQIDNSAFIADGARIIGDVRIGKNSSIWYNSVLRGDVDSIFIGKETNIQDNTVIHTSRFNGKTIIGDKVTIGHSAVIHACQVRDLGFIGMGAILMDNVVVESYGFIAAGALVTPGKIVGPKELWAGRPAKFIRKISEEEIILIEDSSEHYANLAKEYML